MDKRVVVFVSLLIVIGLVVPTAAVCAVKPEKPPDDDDKTPPGTLFYIHNDGTDVAVWTMTGDGSDKTKVTTGITHMDSLSRSKHGGHYWYIGFRKISGDTYPDGLDRQEIFAMRDDNGKTVQLTNDATLASSMYSWMPVWGHDDSYISWVAKRWVSTETGWTLGSGGIWWQDISFDSSGDVTGLTGTPTLEWETDYWYSKPHDAYYPHARQNDLSPDGKKIVYSSTDGELYVVDTIAGTESKITDGYQPRWSPDGNMITFVGGSQSLGVINADGTGENTLVQLSNTKIKIFGIEKPAWSPDSKYVSYKWWQLSLNNYKHGANIYIIKADGTDKTSLTNDLRLSETKVNMDWR